MKIQNIFAIGSVLLFGGAADHCPAATFYTEFTIAAFPVSNGNVAPTDPLSGTIVWTAANIHSDIQSFVSISLTLDQHAYSVGEIGYFRLGSPTTWNGIGGLTAGASTIWNGYDDFSIMWDSANLTPLGFSYASSQRSGIWAVTSFYDPDSFVTFTIAPVPVPEPQATELVILGLTGLFAFRRRSMAVASKVASQARHVVCH